MSGTEYVSLVESQNYSKSQKIRMKQFLFDDCEQFSYLKKHSRVNEIYYTNITEDMCHKLAMAIGVTIKMLVLIIVDLLYGVQTVIQRQKENKNQPN